MKKTTEYVEMRRRSYILNQTPATWKYYESAHISLVDHTITQPVLRCFYAGLLLGLLFDPGD
jgi:hypothetical protein